jgi:hypothetical protein
MIKKDRGEHHRQKAAERRAQSSVLDQVLEPMAGYGITLTAPNSGSGCVARRWWRSARRSTGWRSSAPVIPNIDTPSTCACRKLNPAILVMQSAQDWATKNVPGAIDGARDRRIFLQG